MRDLNIASSRAMKIKIEKCKDKLLIVLPTEALAHLDWGHGDILAAELIDDGLKVVRTMTAHDHAMEIAREIMDEYSETFKALAKS